MNATNLFPRISKLIGLVRLKEFIELYCCYIESPEDYKDDPDDPMIPLFDELFNEAKYGNSFKIFC